MVRPYRDFDAAVLFFGTGIPFLVSALIIDSLKGAFQWIKQHYQIINRVCGGFLVFIGLMMMVGWMGRLLAFLGS